MLTNASGRHTASETSSDRINRAAHSNNSATSTQAIPPNPKPPAGPPAATPTNPDAGTDGTDRTTMGRPRDARGDDTVGRPATTNGMLGAIKPGMDAVG